MKYYQCPIDLARANVDMAVDQSHEHASLADALLSYFDNLRSTLGEYRADEEETQVAEEAFDQFATAQCEGWKDWRASHRVAEQTQAIINAWRDLPGEFYMLKGLMCLDMPLENLAEKREGYQGRIKAREQVSRLYDSQAIARRMDEIQRKAING